ncbi:hypothetical protein [Aliidiomarina indica]|uniref:hypothetical protein n=1 Tax=Aliidiomarina indica TaxID=2749147 RepID=UPI0018903090|nr:hypothetical protein [Aliidiomarina indica]
MILTIIHVIGAAIGLGSATASDSTFMRAIRNRVVSHDQLVLIRSVSHVVMVGLALVVLTGAGLLLHNPSILQHDFFQAKMTAVLILILNALVFHTFIHRFLENHCERELSPEVIGRKMPIFAVSGAISVVSWYLPLIFIVAGRTEFSLPVYLTVYFVLVAGGAVLAYLLMSHILFYPKNMPEDNNSDKPRSKEHVQDCGQSHASSWWVMAVLIVLFLVFIASIAVSLGRVGNVHVVKIIENPPFLSTPVLRVEPGDQVIWSHAPEYPVSSTHPIHFIDGPARPSSNMRPVGREEDGWGFSFAFSEPGVYTYVCPTHPYMLGIIEVGVDSGETIEWPPQEKIPDEYAGPPQIAGVGEIWVNTQFEPVEGRGPGTITIINAENWEVTDVISHPTFNNPHNFRPDYDGRYIFQTQWHSDYLNKIDIETREVVQSKVTSGAPAVSRMIEMLPNRVGAAPAHVFVDPKRELFYLTLNNDGRVYALDFDLNIQHMISTSLGPHGIWVDPEGRWMAVAATLDQKLDIIDLDKMEVAKTFDAPGLPLAAEITLDSRYAMISMMLENKVRIIDLQTMNHVKDVEVGEMPVWPRSGPYNEYVFVPNTGSADISVIELDTLEVVATLPAANGAHGVTFCPNAEGDYYGYVSNKYARTVTVIDPKNLATVGNIALPESAWGGQGIHCFPDNIYDTRVRELHRT